MLKTIKDKLPFIGAICLLLITLINYCIKDDFLTTCISLGLFLFVLFLYIISRNQKNDE